MWLGLSLVLGTIGLGTLFAYLPGLGGRALIGVRALALVAAAGVVITHLMPEAIRAIGAIAVAGLVAGLAVPAAIEHFVRAGERYAFEVEFAGLMLHAATDGVALWSVTHPGHVELGAALGLSLHIAPVTAVLVMREAEAKGRPLLRAALLALATALGLWAGEEASSSAFGTLEPWVSAIASGFLLHVVAHDAHHLVRR